MIAEDQGALSFVRMKRPDEKIIGDLDFRGPQQIRDLTQCCARKNVRAAFTRHAFLLPESMLSVGSIREREYNRA
jgi:hypothetical protein